MVTEVASGAVETEVPFVVAFWVLASWRAALLRVWKEASSAGALRPESSTKENGSGSERLATGIEWRQGKAVGVGLAWSRFSTGAGAEVEEAAAADGVLEGCAVVEARVDDGVAEEVGAEEGTALLDDCGASDD